MGRFSLRDVFWLTLVVALCSIALADEKLPPLPADEKEMILLLEKRWPLEVIQQFCTSKNRWDRLNQNLVLDGERSWKGELYRGKKTGFDRIWWYATIEGKRIAYSLNVTRGDDAWNLEIGGNKSLRSPPKRRLVPIRPM